MPVVIIDLPSRLKRVQIRVSDEGCQQWVGVVHAGIHQRDIGAVAVLRGIDDAISQLVRPLLLFIGGHRIEEIRSVLCATQLGDGVQDERRLEKLRARAVQQDYRAFGEVQGAFAGLHARKFGQAPKVVNGLLAVCAGTAALVPPRADGEVKASVVRVLPRSRCGRGD